jgi:hypothetical protein
MATDRRPRDSVAPLAVIPRPIVKPAAVRTVLSGGTGNKPALARVTGHRVGNNQALAIVPAVAQTEAAEPAIAAGAEAYQVPDRDPAAAPLVVDPAV